MTAGRKLASWRLERRLGEGAAGRLLPGTTPSLYQPSPTLGSRLSAEASYFRTFIRLFYYQYCGFCA